MRALKLLLQNNERKIKLWSIDEIEQYDFAAGSMGPKVEAACSFIERSGQRAVIGSLTDIEGMVNGTAGTQFMLK